MKKLLVAGLIMMSAASAFAGGEKNIRSDEARGMLADGKKVFLLDVRTPDEYRQAHLQGAVLIPMNEVERRLREVPRDKTVIVYCAVGSRSGAVARFLAGKGYDRVYNLSDGIVGWFRRGYPIVR